MRTIAVSTLCSPRQWAVLLGSLLMAAAVQAGSGSAPLQLTGKGPYYQLSLPNSLFTLARDPELSDLRLRNAQGALLPWAWQDTELVTPSTSQHRLPMFALPVVGKADNSSVIALHIRADGSLDWTKHLSQSSNARAADWILDAHAVPGNLLQLRLKLAPQANGLFPLSVEGSDDLMHWHMLASDVAVLQLEHQGQTLRQDQIELGAARARYLRLHWQQPGQAPDLQGVEVESFEQAVPAAPALQWTESWAPQQCDARACTWHLPEGLPVDAVRLRLAEVNTVVQLRILGETKQPLPGSAPPRYRAHHPLHGLRHRDRHVATTGGDGIQRSLLTETVVWRLAPEGQPENETPALLLDGSRPNRLRIEAQHAVAEWGSTPPHLNIGSRSRSLVFLARGAGPITLAWGGSAPEGAAVSLTTLMPTGTVAAMGDAHLELPAIVQVAVPVPAATATAASAPPAATDEHKPWLWAALVVGLLLLGAMAVSLLKQIKPKA